jgi:hypothetical protein
VCLLSAPQVSNNPLPSHGSPSPRVPEGRDSGPARFRSSPKPGLLLQLQRQTFLWNPRFRSKTTSTEVCQLGRAAALDFRHWTNRGTPRALANPPLTSPVSVCPALGRGGQGTRSDSLHTLFPWDDNSEEDLVPPLLNKRRLRQPRA